MRRLSSLASLLVLPLAVLLFAQWPLRELVHAWSREANDLAQIFFALYMAVAVTAASDARAHMSAGHAADKRGRWRPWATALCVVPWALFLLYVSAAPVLASLGQLEKFPETLNPGFFLIKLALWLMALLVAVHAFVTVRHDPSVADG